MAKQISRDYRYYSNKRGYIIYTPKHYKDYIESYTGGFVNAAIETASGGTGRFLSMAQGLAGAGSRVQGGIAAKEDVEEMYANMSDIITSAWTSSQGQLMNSLAGMRSSVSTEIENAKTDLYNLSVFTTLLDQTLTSIQKTPNLKNAYTTIASQWGKDKVNVPDTIPLAAEEIKLLKQVCSSLNVLSSRYSELTSKGMSGKMATMKLTKLLHLQLSTIFGAIGEFVGLNDIENFVDNQVYKNLSIVKNGKSLITGSLQSEDGGTIKPDIITPLLSITSNVDKKKLKFEMKIAASVKNYPSLTGKTEKTLSKKEIKIQESGSVLDYLNRLSPEMKQYAANVLTHDWTKATTQSLAVRQGIASRFFNEWLAGMGNRTSDQQELNVSNFMLVNGRLYSMYDIIKAVQSSFNIKKSGDIDSAIRVSFSKGDSGRTGIANTYIGDPDYPNYAHGFQRSNTVWGELADLQLIAYIKPWIFVDIATKKYGVPGVQVF